MSIQQDNENSESVKYEMSLRVQRIADTKDKLRNPRINVGDEISILPAPTTKEEAYQRLIKLHGQRWFEGLKREFLAVDRIIDAEVIESELEPIYEFHDNLKNYNIKKACDKSILYETKNVKEYEYLRINKKFYLKNRYEFDGPISDMVYGEFVLYKKWLETELTKYANQDLQPEQKNLVLNEVEVQQKVYPPLITYFENHGDVLISKLKNYFVDDRGVKIKILIVVLTNMGLLKIADRGFIRFYNSLKHYFDRDIGTYQSINDFKGANLPAHKNDYDLIEGKLKIIIDAN